MTPDRTLRLLDRRQAGSAADLALAVVGDELTARTAELVDDLCQRHRARQLTAEQALLGVAQLTELADLRHRLEHATRQGRRAAAALTPRQDPAGAG